MATVKYAVLKHWMNINGNRVSQILAVRDTDFVIFNQQCYEFEIPQYVRIKMKMSKRDKLVELKQIKLKDL